jgi:DNA invertase Pin-like site-specific DNA recombinase
MGIDEFVAQSGLNYIPIFPKALEASRRPSLDALLENCHRKKIDVVVVWKFHRFARSLKQLLNALELFRALGIGFVSCTEAMDTSLPHGEMLFQIIGAIAQWERSLIVERVKAGLQHARNQGKRLGRPPLRVLKPDEVTKLRKERARTKTRSENSLRNTGFPCLRLMGYAAEDANRGWSLEMRNQKHLCLHRDANFL